MSTQRFPLTGPINLNVRVGHGSLEEFFLQLTGGSEQAGER